MFSVKKEIALFPWTGKEPIYNYLTTALWSPVVGNRNMALNVLKSWSVELWPENAKEILVQLRINDPDQKIGKRVNELLKRLEDRCDKT